MSKESEEEKIVKPRCEGLLPAEEDELHQRVVELIRGKNNKVVRLIGYNEEQGQAVKEKVDPATLEIAFIPTKDFGIPAMVVYPEAENLEGNIEFAIGKKFGEGREGEASLTIKGLGGREESITVSSYGISGLHPKRVQIKEKDQKTGAMKEEELWGIPIARGGYIAEERPGPCLFEMDALLFFAGDLRLQSDQSGNDRKVLFLL